MHVIAPGRQVPDDVPAQLVRLPAHLGDESALVHDGVVPLAQERCVVHVGEPAVDPVDDVVRAAPARRRRAARVGAAPVTTHQTASLRPGEESYDTTQIEVLTRGSEHVRDEVRLARDAAQDLR